MQTKIKKKPQRRCVGCYESKDKIELIRIVRTPEGEYKIDPSGKLSGRGAYICKDAGCLETAYKGRKLERSFKEQISNDIYENLKQMIENLK